MMQILDKKRFAPDVLAMGLLLIVTALPAAGEECEPNDPCCPDPCTTENKCCEATETGYQCIEKCGDECCENDPSKCCVNGQCHDRCGGEGGPCCAAENKECCGDECFDPETQTCCDNTIIIEGAGGLCCGTPPVSYYPNFQDCCAGVVYTLAFSDCCEGDPPSVYDLETEGCCGGQIYTKATETCCGSTVIEEEGGGCCGTPPEVFDLETEACCNGEEIYTKATETCCDDGTVIQGGGGGCCGDPPEAYDVETEDCCGGEIYTMGTEGCCASLEGAEVYTTATEGCCVAGEDAVVYTLDTEFCCQGVVVEGEGAGCCGDPPEIYDDTEGCCNNEVYELNTKGCCEDEIFTKATEDCCGTGVNAEVYTKATQYCCNDQVYAHGDDSGCPTQTATVMPGTVFCGEQYGAEIKLCYDCLPSSVDDRWWMKEKVAKGTPYTCSSGTITQTSDPFQTPGCEFDRIYNHNGPPGNVAPCTDVTFQTIFLGPTEETVEQCQYYNTQRIEVTATSVTTSSAEASGSCNY